MDSDQRKAEEEAQSKAIKEWKEYIAKIEKPIEDGRDEARKENMA
jgi:hypothetical protein